MDIISLLETLVNEILTAEEKFLKDPKDFYTLETSVKSSTESFSAGFLSCFYQRWMQDCARMHGEN